METIWADWKVVRPLGEGSFGKVYEVVRDRFGIEERSAVKVISLPSTPAEAGSLRSEGMTDNDITMYYKGLVQDFVQEIALMSKLRGHPNIVGYEDYEVVEHKDSFGWDIYIRMELLTPLTSRMVDSNKQPLSLSEEDVRDMAIDLCAALETCEDNNIVHRDIKPDNIFISKSGDYKLGDFGVAKTIDKTVSGLSKKGTYTYMAPEIYKGEPGGLNSDLYSLGVVLYRLLNEGREPFAPPPPQPVSYAQKQEALARRMRGEPFPPPAHASAAMFDIIKKACAYNPRDRYQNAAQMRADLRDLAFKTAAAVKPKQPVVQVINPEATVAVNTPAQAYQQTPPAQTYQQTPQTPQPQMNQQFTPEPPKKKKSGAKSIVILAVVLLLILGLAGGAVILYQNGFFDSFMSSSDSGDEDDEDTKETKKTETQADASMSALDAVNLLVDVSFNPTVDCIKEALPDEVEAYCKEQGAKIDSRYVELIDDELDSSLCPVDMTITKTEKTDVDDVWLETLEECGLDTDKVTFYTAYGEWENKAGDFKESSFPLIKYNGSYYSLETIDMILDIVSAIPYM